MARPKLKIDEKQVVKLASEGASNRDIAALFGVDDVTIANRFSALLGKARAERRMKLRKFQWNSASHGNVAMQIWLGKQLLDQSERVVQRTEDAGVSVNIKRSETTGDAGHA